MTARKPGQWWDETWSPQSPQRPPADLCVRETPWRR